MLRLRPYKSCDAPAIVSWAGDERAFRMWSSDRFDAYPLSPEDLDQYYRGFAAADNHYEMTAFDETGPVGHLILRFTDEAKTTLRFGFVIVDPAKRGQGYGREMLSLAIRYAFEILKAERITLGVFENNPPAARCYRAVGFRDLPPERERFVRLLGEDWRCLELELTREDWLAREKEGVSPDDRLIAFCGLDCGRCEARLATVNQDEALRRKVAEEWSRLNGAEITPEMIHCEGCRLDGVKTPYCADLCPIRPCALRRGLDTCGSCPELETCEKAGAILKNSEEARRNLARRRSGGDK